MTINQAKDLVQKEVLRAWWNVACRGTIEAATGFGKSRVGVLASTYFSKAVENCKILIIVPTETLKNEWEQEFKRWGESKVFKKNVQVECIHTARKFKGNEYDLVICDEIHNYVNGAVNKKFFRNNKYHRILGLSATIEDNLLEHLNKVAPICYTLDLYQAVELGLVSDFTVYNIAVELTLPERKQYNALSKKIAWTWENHSQQAWGSITARTKILYTAKGKTRILKKLVKLLGENNYGVVFSMTKDQANLIKTKLGDKCLPHHSGVTKKRRIEYLKNFADGRTKTRILSSAKTLDEGVNLPRLKYGILMASSSKVKQQNQRVGRCIRVDADGKHAIIVRVYCKDTQEEKWLESSQVKIKAVETTLEQLQILLNK